MARLSPNFFAFGVKLVKKFADIPADRTGGTGETLGFLSPRHLGFLRNSDVFH